MILVSFSEVLSIILVWQTILFSALFWGIYNKTGNYSKKLISLYMLSNVGYFSLVWLNFFSHVKILHYLYPLAMPLLLSFLPLFYFYFRSLTTLKYRVVKKQWNHLLPSLVIFLLQLPFYWLPEADANSFLLHKPFENQNSNLYLYLIWVDRVAFYGIFTAQFLVYLMKFRTNLRMHRLRLELMFSYKENVDLRWLRYLFIGILLFFIGNDITYMIRFSSPYYSLFFYVLGMLLINFFIGYNSLIQNEMVENEIMARMTHYCALHREMTQPKSENQELFIAQELQKYQRSNLKTDTREQIIQRLDKMMEEEELFTDSQINIEDLAMKLSTNAKYLSQAINEVHQRNFFNYINDFRINKAKAMLHSDEHTTFSVEGIARLVGFQSKSSFYTAFKKVTGITPTEYRSKFMEHQSTTDSKII